MHPLHPTSNPSKPLRADKNTEKSGFQRNIPALASALGALTFIASTRSFATSIAISNPSFETPALTPAEGFEYNPSAAGWTFTAQGTANGQSGVAIYDPTGTGFAGPKPPDGSQYGFLQHLGAITQSITFPAAGEYALSLYLAGRPFVSSSIGGSQEIVGDIDSTKILDQTTSTGQAFTGYVVDFTASAGSHTLSFAALDPQAGDNTAYIDDIAVSSIPLTWNNSGTNGGDGATWDINNNHNWSAGGAAALAYTDASGVTFNDDNAGHYNVALNTVVSPPTVTVNTVGSYTLSGTGSINGTGSLTTNNTGTLVLSTVNNYSGGTNINNGTLIANAAGALPATGLVSVAASATLKLAPSTGIQKIAALAIATGGGVDIGNNTLFINYGSNPDPFSTVKSAIATGYNSGTWTGAGIRSSAAAANPKYAVGYGDSADGVAVGLASGQIEIAYTLNGDINLDGVVNGTDFAILAKSFGHSVTNGWEGGDLNDDGTVGGADFALLAQTFGKTASGASIALPQSDWNALNAFAASEGLLSDVPEPTTTMTIAFSAGLLVFRQRRGKTY